MYAKIIDNKVQEFPYYISQLKQDNPQISFPEVLNTETLNEFNIYEVIETTDAELIVDSKTHQRSQEVEQVNGLWTEVWKVTNLPQALAAPNVRAYRNKKLTDSDWTQVADAVVDKAAWAAYRQQLRDITTQAGFPWDVQWPAQP